MARPRSQIEELIDQVLALRSDRIRELLDRHELPRSGAKRDLRVRLSEAADDGEISAGDIIEFLDEFEPWGKQHVLLYRVEGIPDLWQDQARVVETIAAAGAGQLVNEKIQLGLPDAMELSAIAVNDGQIEINAVEARRYMERDPTFDRISDAQDLEIELRAYVHRVSRGLITLRWDIGAGLASLHIAEAHRGYDFEAAEDDFAALVKVWLPFPEKFARVDLQGVVQKLAKSEGTKSARTRSPRFGFASPGGRSVDFISASTTTSVRGEKAIDDTMDTIGKTNRGRLGNVFWLTSAAVAASTLDAEVHTTIMAAESRVRFMRPSDEESIRYVLEQVRALS